MDSKRFKLTNPNNRFQEMKCGVNDRNKKLNFNEVVDELNDLHEENVELKEEIKSKDKIIEMYYEMMEELYGENIREIFY